MKYSLYKKLKRPKKAALIIGTLLLVAALLYGAVKIYSLAATSGQPLPTTSKKTSSYYKNTNKSYETKYFSFSARPSWQAVPAETTDNKFVYRNYSNKLVLEELVFYANNIPSLKANRILPVAISSGRLAAETPSPHCKESLPGQKASRPVEINLDGVAFVCDSDSTKYEVLIGARGGGTVLSLPSPGGSELKLAIYYRDDRAQADPSQLLTVVNSLQIK